MSQSTAPYLPIPQHQSMAPRHQSLTNSSENRFSVPRKPLSSQTLDSRKTSHVSEQQVDYNLDDDRSSKSEKPTQRQRFGKDSLGRLWLVELTSLILAVIAFAAIIITLMLHQDRPIPKWPSLISINTLVSIFTAILKASMLLPIAEGVSQLKWLWFREIRPLIDLERFDSASRGPWGCFLLLVKRHTNYLAALGAIITITAMAVDPFAQQVIQYNYCSTTAPNTAALIPRTNNYTAGTRAANGGGGHASPIMNAAFYGTGLFDPPTNASSSIRINCPTGNCTFPATENGVSYMSLGMCSSCTDISDTITNVTTITPGIGNTTSSYGTYFLPSGISVSPVGNNTLVSTLVLNPPDITEQGMILQTMITFEMLMFDPSVCKDVATLSGCRVWASRCSLTPCIKSYSANVTNGILQERELSSTPLQYLPASAGYAYYGLFTNTTVVDGQNRDCEPTSNPTKRNTLRMGEGNTWVSEAYFKNISSAPYYPPECAFLLGVGSTDALGGSLFETYSNQTIQTIGQDYSGNPWMMQLFDSGAATPDTLDTAISGLANAITAAVRNEGSDVNGVPATGAVLESQTCISVRWQWLALPASLLILSGLFLAATIGQTAADGTGKAWKSSPLALLFHGFCSETVQSVGSVNCLNDMDAAARKMQAQLKLDKHRWKFSEVQSEEEAVTYCARAAPEGNEENSQHETGTGTHFPPPPNPNGSSR
jgi:hypothetical protein